MIHLRLFLLSLSILVSINCCSQVKFEPEDKKILESIFIELKNEKDKTAAELVVLVGKKLKGTNYAAYTLEFEPEELVINLREFDCTTYAENCLAIARTLKSGHHTFERFTKELTGIRYRNGKIEDYPSRLHYFSDWIYENEKRGLVEHVSKEIANIPYPLEIDFMSTHPESYKQLKMRPELVPTIANQEKEISARKMFYLPENKLPQLKDKLHEGDIVGITSSIAGLDIIHVGIVVKQNGKVHLMHASSKAEKVVITENTLYEYLMGSTTATGIMVIRPL